jgi:hypothetical protein
MFKSLFLSFFLFSSAVSSADTNTTIIGDKPEPRIGYYFSMTDKALLWNSISDDLKYAIYLKFIRTSDSNRPRVAAFVWNNFINFATSGDAGTWLGYGKLKLLNSEPIELDKTDGNLYMGGKIIGFWYGHPLHKHTFKYGYEITAKVVIDAINNTIEIKN